MALETVVHPQDPLGCYSHKDFYSLGSPAWGTYEEHEDIALLGVSDQNIEQAVSAKLDASLSPSLMHHAKQRDLQSSSPDTCTIDQSPTGPMLIPTITAAPRTSGRRKRRRTRSDKNKEELENQRMTHIFVERNRRKQMNEYLSVLRSLMPTSYVQRGDQASIIGGAIDFVKELEQLLQSMEVQKQIKQQPQDSGFITSSFAEFTFPQLSAHANQRSNNDDNNSSSLSALADEDTNRVKNQQLGAVLDIEVTVMDSHANLKLLARRRPRQLLKMVGGFQSLGLSIQHLNVTCVDQMVLYSVNVKVEEGSQQLNTVDEIAAAVNQMVCRIQEESDIS